MTVAETSTFASHVTCCATCGQPVNNIYIDNGKARIRPCGHEGRLVIKPNGTPAR